MADTDIPDLDSDRPLSLADDSLEELAMRTFLRSYLELLPARVCRVLDTLRRGNAEDSMDAVLSLKVSSHMAGALRIEHHCRGLEAELRAGLVPGPGPAGELLTGAMRSVLAAAGLPPVPRAA
ncbi:hypothetical protein [Arthrobacter mangrovi]|uniref:HPt domain-containing protein n=1 Tax=Arthrobacter mangrovi TaxID=2966350 RepID=A0ABQ5MV94_9MICC|nr:hypothetical protein [Arthrobacter mangrovi]GLB67901.1 hypothetical protein AHIS1636_23410 [Arthrobacter mangrovi]